MRGATAGGILYRPWIFNFNPRTPCGVRHYENSFQLRNARNFNPRTPCGVRPNIKGNIYVYADFNPRTPCGVRHAASHAVADKFLFQSTHPMRGATLHFLFSYVVK